MDCPSPVLTESGGYFQRMKERLRSTRLPLEGSLEVTPRCNVRCVHCYMGDFRSGDPTLRELSLEEIRGLVDQIAEAGCMDLLLTGGEPFVRPDMLDIYDYTREKGLIVTIFTNGTLLNPRIADHLAELPPFGMEISLYGASAETYERVTGIPGSYERCLRGIDLLLERGIPLKLKTMLLTLNVHEIDAMGAFAASRGLKFRFDPLVNGAHDDKNEGPLSYRVDPGRVIEIERQDEVRCAEMNKFVQRYAGGQVDSSRLYTCGAGRSSFHIDAYGRMSPCITSRARSYDLRAGTFREGWEQFMPREYSQPATRTTRCTDCRLRSFCEMCVGRAYTESGDAEKPVDYLCQLAHLRAREFKI